MHCNACKVDFPIIGDIPWLFAEPDATLAEWRGRLHYEIQSIAHRLGKIDGELKAEATSELTRRRLQLLKSANEHHRDTLRRLLAPVDIQSASASYDSYLALRTRLPSDQGLHTYYANVHRDWAWGDDENAQSVAQIERVAGNEPLGNVLVLGAGAGRLAYDIHTQLDCTTTIASDFNPLLLLIAAAVARGDTLELYEFPIAPSCLDNTAVLRTLSAPKAADDGFNIVAGDALRAPFAAGKFDTVVTPWLVDIVNDDFRLFGQRVNALLGDGGRWLNFGSLAFSHPSHARCYSREEALEIVADCGFAEPQWHEDTIPYMNSPASRHGRTETVFSFAAKKTQAARPARHKALPDWIVTGKDPVPALQSFQTQAMTTRIYSFIMSMIDGKRTIKDMSLLMEQQQLMTRQEAEPAIRNFLIKMFDDAERQSGF